GAVLLVNEHYAYYPTVGAVLGRPVTGQVAPGRLGALERTASDAGRRPSVGIGRLVAVDIPAAASGFHHRAGAVYLPPAYFRGTARSFPVVVMLGGTPGSPWAWVRAGEAVATANRYAAAHGGVAPILAFVDENGSFLADTECVDSGR